MSKKADICVVCAWRADCQKKFSISGRDMRCPDFVRDVSLPEDEEEQKEEKNN
jgi:Uma2 family endonuclease